MTFTLRSARMSMRKRTQKLCFRYTGLRARKPWKKHNLGRDITLLSDFWVWYVCRFNFLWAVTCLRPLYMMTELSLVLSLLLVTFFCNAVAVLLNYTSTISFHAIDEEFFPLGFSAPEIFLFLVNAVHGTRLSLRQLKRLLSNRGCALKRHLLCSSP